MIARLGLILVLAAGSAAAQTTFSTPIEIATGIQRTADPLYNPVVVHPADRRLTVAWLGYNAAGQQVLRYRAETGLGTSQFNPIQEVGPAEAPGTKLFFDFHRQQSPPPRFAWLQPNDEGQYEWRVFPSDYGDERGDVFLTTNILKLSRPALATLPVHPPCPGPGPASVAWIALHSPDTNSIRMWYRTIPTCDGQPPPWWIEMRPVTPPDGLQLDRFHFDIVGTQPVLVLRCVDPTRTTEPNMRLAVCFGRQETPLTVMHFDTPFWATDWLRNIRHEQIAMQETSDLQIRCVLHATFAFDPLTENRRAYLQATLTYRREEHPEDPLMTIVDFSTNTSMEGEPPSMVVETGVAEGAARLLYAGPSRFGPRLRIEPVKFRERFSLLDIVPVQELAVVTDSEILNRPQDEVPMVAWGYDEGGQLRARLIALRGDRLTLLNDSRLTPPATPSPTPIASPTPTLVPTATAVPSPTPTVETFLQVMNALLARPQRTPTPAQVTAGDANGDRVWDAADMSRLSRP